MTTSPTPTIERLARVLIDRIGSPWTWDEMPSEIQELWRGHVLAILTALRDPDNETLVAGMDAFHDAWTKGERGTTLALVQLQAMIDHLINEARK